MDVGTKQAARQEVLDGHVISSHVIILDAIKYISTTFHSAVDFVHHRAQETLRHPPFAAFAPSGIRPLFSLTYDVLSATTQWHTAQTVQLRHRITPWPKLNQVPLLTPWTAHRPESAKWYVGSDLSSYHTSILRREMPNFRSVRLKTQSDYSFHQLAAFASLETRQLSPPLAHLFTTTEEESSDS